MIGNTPGAAWLLAWGRCFLIPATLLSIGACYDEEEERGCMLDEPQTSSHLVCLVGMFQGFLWC
jgi:hypothetical protein